MENAKTVGETKNATIYDITMEVARIKGEKDGKKYDFLAYSGYDKHGKKCKFKFTKDCQGQPVNEGIYVCKIDKTMINKDKSSRYNDYWVRKVESYTDYDGFKGNDEDLPF